MLYCHLYLSLDVLSVKPLRENWFYFFHRVTGAMGKFLGETFKCRSFDEQELNDLLFILATRTFDAMLPMFYSAN